MRTIKYDAAIKALAAAVRIDEAKAVRDKAVALQVYAKQAQDPTMVAEATEIRVLAETRSGEILIDMATTGSRAAAKDNLKRGSRSDPKSLRDNIPTLKDMKITSKQASRWRKLALLRRAYPKQWTDRLEQIIAMAVAATEGEKAVVREARAANQREKTKNRKKREKDLAGKILALPDKKYGVIVADPEWKFETWSELGKDRSAENHYSVSAMPIIKSRNVDKIAADDAVLFLWATQPMLPQALEVMGAWGFYYVSHCVWAKDKIGTGYWFRNKHELLLVGTRGNVPAPAQGTQWDSVIEAPVTKHSEKPEIFMRMIEEYFPNLPKIELNARETRPGWDSWGTMEFENVA